MQTSDLISILALVISCASFIATVLFSYRDKAKLITKSVLYDDHYGDVPRISISIVNAGRRPIVLRMWGGPDGTTGWAGTMLNSGDGGRRLAEHELFEFSLQKHDLVMHTPEDDFVLKDLWVEDTLGRRHRVKGAKENIAKLWSTSSAT